MTTKQQSPPVTAASASNSASRQAAQILYRMANSQTAVVASGSSSSITTEPITPVLVAGPTMLQPPQAHFAISNFQQPGGSGLQQAHNFIPVYFQSSGPGGPGQLKQDGSGGMTFQFQPQQYQMIQQQPQSSQQQGRTVFQLNLGGDQQQYQVARMSNGSLVQQQQQQQPQMQQQPQATGKGRAGGRKSSTKDDKLTSEELDRRKVRRERNKQAAARCRKRRMDQTNVLTEETDGLEAVQSQLKDEIEKFQQDINEIQFILDAHRATCPKDIPVTTVQTSPSPARHSPPRARSVAPVPVTVVSDTIIMPPPPVIQIAAPSITGSSSVPSVPEAGTSGEPPAKKRPTGTAVPRPASLPVKSDLQQQMDLLAMPTPSPSKLVFNFESHSGLTPTGMTPTGLTPLIPSCLSDVQDKDSEQSRPEHVSRDGTSPKIMKSL